MLNPAALFKAKAVKDTFIASHPELPAFLRKLAGKGVRKGAAFHLHVDVPGGESLDTRFTLTAQDAQSLGALLDLLGYKAQP